MIGGAIFDFKYKDMSFEFICKPYDKELDVNSDVKCTFDSKINNN
jgi:hypothetical protein